jgi:DNA-binding HxlR family transcriptional regulator
MSLVPERRRYDAACPIATALDTVGERWTLLILRELFPGPLRFSQLKAAIHGINATILSRRLDQMQDEGLVEPVQGRTQSAAYGATLRATRLWPILMALASWGLGEIKGNRGRVTPATAATAFAALDPARGPKAAIGFTLDGERVEWHPERAVPLTRVAGATALEVHATAQTLLDLASGRIALERALAEGSIRLLGEEAARSEFAAHLAKA